MSLKDLQLHVLRLVSLKAERTPVASCYMNFEAGHSAAMAELTRALRRCPGGLASDQLDEILNRIQEFVGGGAPPKCRGAAVFARGGTSPFFLGLRLHVPLPTSVTLDNRPHIYPLVEVKDSYDRYVVMLATERTVRILEVNLGAVTGQIWRTRPELRHRAGREWTKQHYHDHRRERTHLFLKKAVKTLGDVMSSGGHRHFILAGDSRVMAQVKKVLPRPLAEKLFGAIPAPGAEPAREVVAAALSSFQRYEELESRAKVETLRREIGANGPAVVGTVPCLRALRRRQAVTLILAREYNPGRGWCCLECGSVRTVHAVSDFCPACGGVYRSVDLKEEAVRTAERHGCEIETVTACDELMQLGGIGCLLRCLPSEVKKSRRAA